MQAAVVIGVNKVSDGLPWLNAAASGAREVAEWLAHNDYEVHLFTDEAGPVERRDIFGAVTALVEAGNVTRLIIFFAGHGFLRGPGDELWLLSGAPNDAGEAVALSTSAAMARYRGIPQIVFISDACRVVPKTGIHSGITGNSIFPNRAPSPGTAEIDFYYGTHPGDPALERDDTQAERAHGLFTRALVDAHQGAPAEALLSLAGRDYVRNSWLKSILRDRVDLRAQDISLFLTQKPDVQIQIVDGYIAQNKPRATDATRPPSQPRSASKGLGDGFMNRSPSWRGPAAFDGSRDELVRHGGDFNTKALEERVAVIKQSEPPFVRNELGTGMQSRISCHGEQIEVFSLTPEIQVSSLDGSFALKFTEQKAAGQFAVRFEDGSGMLLPALRDYECEVVRDDGRTLALSYTWKYYRDPQLAELRAEVFGAATLGLLATGREAARALAGRVRQSKRADPILGIVAALGYALSGDLAGARSVRRYMRRDLGVDLFDAWLLGGMEQDAPVYPALPLLNQSWSFIEAFSAPVDHNFRSFERVPGFWTVFGAEAMNEVMERVAGSVAAGV